MSADQLEPFLVRPHGQRLHRVAQALAKSNGTGSSSNLPASIFEKSRMSLMIDSSDSADSRTMLQVFALLGGQRRVEHQFGHADDGVHRRADLVAHVGQERALGPIGGLGGFFRHAQFGFVPLAAADVVQKGVIDAATRPAARA